GSNAAHGSAAHPPSTCCRESFASASLKPRGTDGGRTQPRSRLHHHSTAREHHAPIGDGLPFHEVIYGRESLTLSGFMSNTTHSWPPSNRRLTILAPILPRPIMP